MRSSPPIAAPSLPFHLAAHHEQVAVDPRAAQQDDVRVDRQHAAGDVAGHA